MNLKEITSLFPHECYICGGYVRDYILNIESNDVDICSKTRPDELIEILKGNNINHYYNVNSIKHGTVTFETSDSGYVEHTTFRADKHCDGRHANVEFSDSLEEDSKRRDFTCNAMYISLKDDKIIDFYNGIKDLKSKNIRFVGNPESRIKEDFLRIYRYYRFTNRFNFNLNKKYQKLFKNFKNELCYVSDERKITEFKKMLSDGLNYKILENMVKNIDVGIMGYFKTLYDTTSSRNKYHGADNVLKHSFDVYRKTYDYIINNQ